MARTVQEIETEMDTVRLQMKALKAERRRSLKTDPALTWLPVPLHRAYKKRVGAQRIAFLHEARLLDAAGLLDLPCRWYDHWMFHYSLDYYFEMTFASNGSVLGHCWKSKEGIGSGSAFGGFHAETLDAFLKLPDVAARIADARQYRSDTRSL